MQHLQLSRGTVSLTERVLRSHQPDIARYLRNAMLATSGEQIDLLLSPASLSAVHRSLEHLHIEAHSGQQSLLLHLRDRWIRAFCSE